ncbi:MAG: hypothetical protein WBD17_03115 [Candidatus Omnitrophota bacterium]
MRKHFAVIDSGPDEITAVAARWANNGDYLVEGFCRGGSRGLSRGIIEDVAAATDSISGVLNSLKERSKKNFSDVYAGISSPSIDITSSSGVVLLSRYGREINENDIKKCVRIGSTIKMPLDREALHYMVEGFSVDGESSIKNPLNLEGVKLSAMMNIVTISAAASRNLAKCITMAGFVPAGFIFSGLASSYRILEEDDRRKGSLLVDVAPDMTEALIFKGGILTGCRVFSVGLDRLLSKNEGVEEEQVRGLVSKITLLPGWDKVRRIVMTGRGTMNDSLIERFEGYFGSHVEVGTCIAKPFEELPPERMRYLGNIGMLDYLREKRQQERLSGNLIKRGLNRVFAFVDRYF